MKKVMVILLVAALLCGSVGCASGVSQSEYDALKAELAEMKGEATASPEIVEAPDNKPDENGMIAIPQTDNDGFNEEETIESFDVTEYSLSNSYFNYAFLAIKNNSEFTLTIAAQIKFFDGDALVGAKTVEERAVAAGTETLLYTISDEKFTRTEYEFDVERDEYYEAVVQDLTFDVSHAKNKEIVSVTNNGADAAEFVQGIMLFFKEGNLVDSKSSYFIDDDNELKPGKTISKELHSYEDFDAVKLFLSGRK